jgi:hypothetical protein
MSLSHVPASSRNLVIVQDFCQSIPQPSENNEGSIEIIHSFVEHDSTESISEKRPVEKNLKTTNNIFCSICLDEESDNNHHIYKMVTQCNHYFHKSCFYRANREKNCISCPYCKTNYPITYTREKYNYSQLNYDTIFIIRQIQKITAKIGITNYAISGSFAVHMHQIFHQFGPKWKYNDIDIYYNNYIYEIYIPEIMKIDNLIIMKTNDESTEEKYKSYSYFSSLIKGVDKLSVYIKKKKSNNKNDNEIILQKILSFDLIYTYQRKPYEIIDTFDLDCCKISMTFNNYGIKMYIHNDFYVDSYKIIDKKNTEKIYERIKKYRERGFLCMDLDNS